MSTNVIKQTLLGEPGSQIIKMVVRSNERGPKGEKGDPGPQGPQGLPGERGADGAIHYRAGTGIMISDENIIYATGGSIAEWGGIQGDIADQTDLQNALNAKQDVMADFTGTNGVISGKRGAVPAPGIDKYYSVLMGRGGWRSLGNLILKQDGTQIINFNPAIGSGTADIVSPVKIASTVGNVAQLTNSSNNNIYPNIVSGSIPSTAVKASQIDFTTMPGNYSTTEIDTGYTWVDDSPIYKKTVSFGTLPDNTFKTVAHGISNLSRVIRLEGYACDSGLTNFLPLPYSANGVYPIDISVVGSDIKLYTYTDRTSLTECYITLYYTKTS